MIHSHFPLIILSIFLLKKLKLLFFSYIFSPLVLIVFIFCRFIHWSFILCRVQC
ncbi:hypothetical protein TorRG33x02_194510 [Trema orientale]|uniref:Transmembrane protein n=1 Tax=Trema orientale TaxID=63057 RepID=A0A2P5EGR6_TREOI|nr:hypothetical protein TorRG33x02_194510 [Trema orientale]